MGRRVYKSECKRLGFKKETGTVSASLLHYNAMEEVRRFMAARCTKLVP